MIDGYREHEGPVSTPIVEEIQTNLWADVLEMHADASTRPYLAHYTSVSTLERIIANQEIWLSNPLFMNDREELRFGMLEGASAFNNSQTLKASCSASNYQKLTGYFNQYFERFAFKHAFDTYVACFSGCKADDVDGRLSMWRGYGANGGGAAFVIDTSKFAPLDDSPLKVGKVAYRTTADRRQWITGAIDRLAHSLSHAGSNLSDLELNHIAFFWIERLKVFSLLTKHVGFSEEEEWRIFYLREHDKSDLLEGMMSYAITANGAEPKLKLKVQPIPGVIGDDVSIPRLLHRIILGPSISTSLAAASVMRILEKNGMAHLTGTVIASSIPYRARP